jgi:hypothetical protein
MNQYEHYQKDFSSPHSMTEAEQKREKLAVQMTLIVVILLAVAFFGGNYLGTKEASQACAAKIAEGVNR